jgi:CDP-diglyceride synthetase
MEDDQQDPMGNYQGKQPWFGPKRFGGIGYGPRTWQGFVVSAASAALVIIVATITKGHSPLLIAAIVLVVVVHLAIIAIQRRWTGS